MKISSNNYDYYNLIYSPSILSNVKTTEVTSNSSEDETSAVSSSTRKYSVTEVDYNAADLNYTTRILARSLQLSDDTAEKSNESSVGSSDLKESIKEDLEAIKTADIDSLSSDEIKELLENFKNDMEAASPYRKRGNGPKIDLDSMSESDMREMLKKIQERASKPPIHSEDEEQADMISSIKEDIDSIREADIDSLSSEEVKELLSKLNDDIKAMPRPMGLPAENVIGNKESDEANYIDIDDMSESDMRDLLKQIKEQIGSEALTA